MKKEGKVVASAPHIGVNAVNIFVAHEGIEIKRFSKVSSPVIRYVNAHQYIFVFFFFPKKKKLRVVMKVLLILPFNFMILTPKKGVFQLISHKS